MKIDKVQIEIFSDTENALIDAIKIVKKYNYNVSLHDGDKTITISKSQYGYYYVDYDEHSEAFVEKLKADASGASAKKLNKTKRSSYGQK